MEESPQKTERPHTIDKECDAYLSQEKERFMEYRLQGFSPLDAVLKMDREDNRKRNKKAAERHSSRLERATQTFRERGVATTEMSEPEFERWRRTRLEQIAMFPKEATAFAMTALEKLSELRKERLFGSYDSAISTLEITLEELERLCKIDLVRVTGHLVLKARQEAVKMEAEEGVATSPHSVSDPDIRNAAPQAMTRVLGDTSPKPAILAALRKFLGQEERIVELLKKSIQTIEDGQVTRNIASA